MRLGNSCWVGGGRSLLRNVVIVKMRHVESVAKKRASSGENKQHKSANKTHKPAIAILLKVVFMGEELLNKLAQFISATRIRFTKVKWVLGSGLP